MQISSQDCRKKSIPVKKICKGNKKKAESGLCKDQSLLANAKINNDLEVQARYF